MGTRRERLTAPVVLAALVLVASVALHLRDPRDQGSWGVCPWWALTGTWCPGCGSLRAVHDLTHGDLASAASSNLLFVGALPLLALGYLRWVRDAWTGVVRRADARRVTIATVAAGVLTLGFWLVRNLEVGAALAP